MVITPRRQFYRGMAGLACNGDTSCAACARRSRGMGGLGLDWGGAAIGAITGAFGKGGSGGGGTPSNVVTVNPDIQTQVSPQISPVFQQQYQPTNSAATAGTSQLIPSLGGGVSSYPPGPVNNAMPLPLPAYSPESDTGIKPFTWLVIAGVALYVFMDKPKKAGAV